MIRVLIVDDSLTSREVVAERLRRAGIHIIGEADDGREAVHLTHELHPDVVLMDVLMPIMDGLTATRRIMDEVPTPVIILSAATNEQDLFKTYDALAAGALEVCMKPSKEGASGQAEWDAVLLVVGAAAQVKVARVRAKPASGEAAWTASARRPTDTVLDLDGSTIVVIGASTGGPAAIRKLLAALPADYPLPILVALHGNRALSSSIGGWLDRECSMQVSEAVHDKPLPQGPGVVLTVPPGCNLRIRRGKTMLSDARDNPGCAPSIDEMFTSVAEHSGAGAIGVLLTGMGADGAEGLRRIRDAGGQTIAQDEASCVVFGMPAAAIRLGAAQHVTPLEEIPRLLNRLARPPRRMSRRSGVNS